ncbi:MAG: VOC family protein, partial [Chloroflexi bacterium]|nr:VOC family protein [Chloroflexota bacterium]
MGEIKITRINHVGIPISNRKKTLPFYRDVLGLNVIPSQVDG